MKILFILIISLSIVLGSKNSQIDKETCNESDIVGYWLSPKDEISGRMSIVEIIKKDGKYFAYNVVFMDSLPANKDEHNQNFFLRDRDILGSVYIYNLERNTQNSYINGRYYDFNNGKVFHLKIKHNCDILTLIISIDNIGVLGSKKVYQHLSSDDVGFYIKDKFLHIDFSGVEN
ncbi:DUF2147 domain-containing protein [Helicobacter sp. MIT 14-3879]|uniref:DUF2147 domain-containing protein n=1 Tax=Helicobacter sp. MIT 14-3879 TaxID=2040649 RepID=UPI000E1F196C|nr:DUF2147 domain-containing protein [Helicobacter sp. MIT 14-3879]RDU63953.1 DUF2147 domain-containing protein [Helicobacter sp. MIT 14-3879]